MYNHLSKEERDQISFFNARGLSLTEIGRRLNRHKSTISRELRRNSRPKGNYMSIYAQQKSEKRWKSSHKRLRLKSEQIRKYVIEKIQLGWSPDLIAGRLKVDYPDLCISHEAIYQYIYNEKPELGVYLPRKRVKRFPKRFLRKRRTPHIPDRTSIQLRPEEANSRKEFGHFEADTIVSRKSKVALNVLVERKSRFTFISKLNRKTSEEVFKNIIISFCKFPSGVVKSITYDNGTEFACHKYINRLLEIDSYFCEPYHSWEKGTVENRNSLIRRFLPKKTDLKLASSDDLSLIQDWLNNRPMKCLGYNTPKEIFMKNLGVAFAP
jgi:transposase, IS30 family